MSPKDKANQSVADVMSNVSHNVSKHHFLTRNFQCYATPQWVASDFGTIGFRDRSHICFAKNSISGKHNSSTEKVSHRNFYYLQICLVLNLTSRRKNCDKITANFPKYCTCINSLSKMSRLGLTTTIFVNVSIYKQFFVELLILKWRFATT